MDVLLLLSYLLAFFTDGCIAFLVGYKLGPERARRLICNDPEYKATKLALEQVQRDMLVVRHDFEGMRDTMLQSGRNVEKTVTEAIKALPKPEFSATMQLPVQMQDAVQRDLRAVARSVFKEVVSSDLEELLDKAVQKAMQGGSAPESIEQANKLADEAELVAYLDQLAQAYNLPPAAVAVAKRLGKAAVPWLNARYSLGLEEVLP